MKGQNLLIATFSVWREKKRTAINGMVEPLLTFFFPEFETIDLIDGAHPGDEETRTRFEYYQNKKLKKTDFAWISFLLSPFLKLQNTNGTQIVFKLRDFLSVLELSIRKRKRYDLFIGLESVFTLSGIVLKKLGVVKTVVYYVSDYAPNRYSQKLLNNIYLWLDRTCCYYADFIWDVSPAMHPARIKAGLDVKKSAPVILVPNALFPKQINTLSTSKLKPYSLAYAGTLGPENGPQIAIEAMPKITKRFPKAVLHIVGGNETYENDFKLFAKKHHLEKNIIFHGFVSDATKISKLIRTCMIGLAPYKATPNSARWFADATKNRLYMGAGLPVITTRVPPLGSEIAKKGAGIIVDDTADALASAVIKIFLNKKDYEKMRKNAILFAKQNTWENSYKNAVSCMQTI